MRAAGVALLCDSGCAGVYQCCQWGRMGAVGLKHEVESRPDPGAWVVDILMCSIVTLRRGYPRRQVIARSHPYA